MDNEAAGRWRPVIRAIVENQKTEEAIDSILRLLEPPARAATKESTPEPPTPVPAKPPPTSRRKARSAQPPTEDAAEDGIEHKEPLAAFEYFSVEQAADFIGLKSQSIYNFLRDNPGRLTHRHEKGARGGHERIMLQGRSLNQWRYEREQARKPRRADTEEPDDEGKRTVIPFRT
jgi:hypothetical protein